MKGDPPSAAFRAGRDDGAALRVSVLSKSCPWCKAGPGQPCEVPGARDDRRGPSKEAWDYRRPASGVHASRVAGEVVGP